MHNGKQQQVFKKQQGVTLVELMVSMVIGLIIISGIVTVVVSTHSSFKTETEGSFIQENARFAFEMLARDARLAGSLGCADPAYTYISDVVNTTGDPFGGLYTTAPIDGYEASATASDYPAALAGAVGSDAVILRYANPEKVVPVQTYNSTTGEFSLYANHPFSLGDKLVVIDSSCRNAGYFSNTSNSSSTLSHAGAPNCANSLYSQLESKIDCSNAVTPALKTYREGAEVMEYATHAYFVADSTLLPGVPALKRAVLTASGYRTEELAQGVEKLEIKYGVDINNSADHVTAYLDADEVSDWQEVLAVRVELVFKSQIEVFSEAQTIVIGGQTYNDKYMRQLAAATVKIRNR